MTEGPNWREVREALESLALAEVSALLNRLYAAGLKGLVVLARLPEPAGTRTPSFGVFIGMPLELTAAERNLLLAAAVNGEPQLKPLIDEFESRGRAQKTIRACSVFDFLEEAAAFEDTARRLLSPQEDRTQDEGDGR
jgi:hypothetical protein